MDANDFFAAAKAVMDTQTYCFAVTVGENLEANARIVQISRLRDDWTLGFLTEKRCRKYREIERTKKL